MCLKFLLIIPIIIIIEEFNSESTDSQLNAEHWFARIKKL